MDLEGTGVRVVIEAQTRSEILDPPPTTREKALGYVLHIDIQLHQKSSEKKVVWIPLGSPMVLEDPAS